MGAQRTAAESRQLVRGGCRSDAGSAIAYDHNVAFAVDRQIEHAGGGCPVIDGFGARNLTGEPHHGLRCSAAVAIDAHKAAERPMMRHEIVGDRAGHRCCAPCELEIERDLALAGWWASPYLSWKGASPRGKALDAVPTARLLASAEAGRHGVERSGSLASDAKQGCPHIDARLVCRRGVGASWRDHEEVRPWRSNALHSAPSRLTERPMNTT